MIAVVDKFLSYYGEIETLVRTSAKDAYLGKTEILEALVQRTGVSERRLKETFSQLSERDLLGYIGERKMMLAYEFLITSDSFNVEPAIAMSGYDNQNSFGREFKRLFDMTPKQAFLRKDRSYIKDAMTMNSIITERHIQSRQTSDEGSISTGNCGMLHELMVLQEFYGFDDEQIKTAFRIADRTYGDVQNTLLMMGDIVCNYQETVKMLQNEKTHITAEDSAPVIALLNDEDALEACLLFDARRYLFIGKNGYAAFVLLYDTKQKTGNTDFEFLLDEFEDWLEKEGRFDSCGHLDETFDCVNAIHSFKRTLFEKVE